MSKKKVETFIGPCSKWIESQGWVTEVPVDLLKKKGYIKLEDSQMVIDKKEYYNLKGVTPDNKCKSYHKDSKRIRLYNPITGKPFSVETQIGVCWGTAEIDECKCGGDPSKCDFYPEKRGGK